MALKSKPRKNLVITERDKDVLSAIYQAGIIAAGHIVRLFFDGTSYGYVRLRMLFDAGYVGTDPYLEPVPGTKKRRKVTSFYYLRKKGIDYLAGLSKNTLRPAWKNKIHKKRFKEFYLMGEIWCSLLEEGIIAKPHYWHPSRLAKKRLGINHFVPLHSVFYPIHRSGDKFDALYFFKENTNGRKITKLRNILPAVDLSGANRHFIICETHKIMKIVLQRFTIKYPECDVYIVLQDHVSLLLKYLKRNNDKIFYQELLATLKAGEKIKLLQSGPLEAAPYWVKSADNSKIFLTELVTGKLLNLTELKYKAKNIHRPDKLCLYSPDIRYFETIKFILPKNLESLHVVYREEK